MDRGREVPTRRIPNARGRYLADLTLSKDQWRALWVPPTLPPYELQGRFAGVQNGNATKTLVFSGWKVVPPALAGLVGYEAEGARRAASSTLPQLASAEQPQLLSPAVKVDARSGEKRVQRVAVFGLVYPSSVLAGAIDPIGSASASHCPLREVLAAETAALRPLLRELADRVEGSRLDRRWYWAAPMLLDQLAGVDVAGLIKDQLSGCGRRDADGGDASTALDSSLDSSMTF